jgi:small-conductance mechanosensitive channel
MSLPRRPIRLPAAAFAFLLVTAAPALAQVAAVEAETAKFFSTGLAKLRLHAQEIAQAIPALPQYLAEANSAFRSTAGDMGPGRFLIGALLCLVAGFAVEWAFRRALAGLQARRAAEEPRSVNERLTRFGIDALLEFGAVIAFMLGVLIALMVEEWPGALHEAGIAFLVALLWLRLALAALHLLLRPSEGPGRMLAAFDLDVPAARFWHRHLAAFVGWFAFGWAIISTLRALGMPRPGQQLLAYALGVGLVAIALLIIWRRPMPAATEAAVARKAGRWLASLGAVALWAVWAAGAMAIFWLMTVATFLPITIAAVRRAARHIMRPVADEDGKPGTVSVAAVFVEQGLRAAVIVGGILVLLWGWRLDVGSLAAQESAAARLLRGGLHALIILLVADLAWSLLKALADNALANAQVSAGVDAAEARRRARVRTLLPIGRNIAAIVLLVMAALMALAALGVEIAPLIASAGVVGVAVGFGCQTVVRDIISGMFYMLDDAFRVGEYIQSGNYKGVVESFSLRSVKLRHQRGPLFTIPFGSLGAVQNMSRDWVMVKDQIGITYDSDVDKAKKLIKQIGQELAKDPDLGHSILQPLKMQGIETFGQYAINIRMKMMTKPGEQFVIRRKANAMIKKAFDENGIKFAFPTVQLAGGGNEAAAAAAAAQEVLKPETDPAR